jgi:hypothetical protein
VPNILEWNLSQAKDTGVCLISGMVLYFHFVSNPSKIRGVDGILIEKWSQDSPCRIYQMKFNNYNREMAFRFLSHPVGLFGYTHLSM